jgi:hypothetical protein
VELGSGNYRSQSTTVPVNGAYILAEDQNGVGAQFGSSRNYFDYGSGVKNTIATTSENFVTAQGNFSTAEQGSLVSQQLTGVCNSSSGCTGNWGMQTSVNQYKLYPTSLGDYHGYDGTTDSTGRFFGSGGGGGVQGMSTLTGLPALWWTRSNSHSYNDRSMQIRTSDGGADYYTVHSYSYGFRPAGVLNLDQKWLNSLKELGIFKIGIIDAPFSISTTFQYVSFHNHYIGVMRTLKCYTVYRRCDCRLNATVLGFSWKREEGLIVLERVWGGSLNVLTRLASTIKTVSLGGATHPVGVRGVGAYRHQRGSIGSILCRSQTS